MKKLLIILLLSPVFLNGQNLLLRNNAGKVLSFGNLGITIPTPFPERMLTSYLEINSGITYTQVEQDTILSRLSEDYIVETFGVDGLDKQVCDFFLFLETSNSTTVTRPNTKTGSTLRWNLGGGIYSQNDLPAQNTNGYITVTSTDGFENWARLDLVGNNFIGYVPSLINFKNIDILFLFTNTLWQGDVILDLANNTLTNINISVSDLSTDLEYFDGTSNITTFNINDCDKASGNIKYLNGNSLMTSLFARGTGVTGWLDSIVNINSAQIFLQNTELTGYAGLGNIPIGWSTKNIFIEINNWSTPSLDNFLLELDSNWTTASNEIRINSMNQFRTVRSSAAYSSLVSKGVTFDAPSITYLDQFISLAYTDDDTKQEVAITTYTPGSDETVHPSILTFSPAFQGYTYWLGITPFQDKNIIYENPSIYATNDISTMTAATNNPLDNFGTTYYNNDPDIIYTDDSLYCMWRISLDTVYYKASVDGNAWSEKRYMFNEAKCYSPSIIEKDDTLFVYYNSSEPTADTAVLKRRYSTTGINGDFTASETVANIPEVTNRHWWHLDVNYIDSKFYMVLADAPDGGSGNANNIYIAESTNGLNFTLDTKPMLNNNKSFSTFTSALYSFYRPSFSVYEDHYILFFTVIDNTTDNWYLGNTEMWIIP